MSTTTPSPPGSSPAAEFPPRSDASAAPARPPSLVPVLRRLHFYAGVLVAPFLVVAAVTGLAYTVAPQMERLVYADELRVAEVGAAPRPLAEQVRAAQMAAQDAAPDGTLFGVATGASPDHTTRVAFSTPELGEDLQRTVYVDPYTAEVRGSLTTWFGYTPLTAWLDNFHRHLQLGEPGRLYSELAASWLWVLVAAGIVLWLDRQRKARRRARALLLPDLGAGRGVRRTRSWHASVGLSIALGLLFLSATGLTWSTFAGARLGAGLDAIGARAPELDTTLGGRATAGGEGQGGAHDGHASSAGGGDGATVGRVAAGALAAGLDGPLEITPPAEAGTAWTVAQVDDVWPVRKDRVAVDGETGAVLARVDWAEHPPLAQLSSLGISAHMGILFGPVNQVLLAAVAVGLLSVILWGYRMWWQRRPTRADRRRPVGSPPLRGMWREVPRWQVAAAVVVVLLVSWVVPLLGATLLAFLVLDAVLGRRRRTPESAAPLPAVRALPTPPGS